MWVDGVVFAAVAAIFLRRGSRLTQSCSSATTVISTCPDSVEPAARGPVRTTFVGSGGSRSPNALT